jgi:hypothetical protein
MPVGDRVIDPEVDAVVVQRIGGRTEVVVGIAQTDAILDWALEST